MVQEIVDVVGVVVTVTQGGSQKLDEVVVVTRSEGAKEAVRTPVEDLGKPGGCEDTTNEE